MRAWVCVVFLGAAVCFAGDYPSTSGAGGEASSAVSAGRPGVAVVPEAATAAFIGPDRPLPEGQEPPMHLAKGSGDKVTATGRVLTPGKRTTVPRDPTKDIAVSYIDVYIMPFGFCTGLDHGFHTTGMVVTCTSMLMAMGLTSTDRLK